MTGGGVDTRFAARLLRRANGHVGGLRPKATAFYAPERSAVPPTVEGGADVNVGTAPSSVPTPEIQSRATSDAQASVAPPPKVQAAVADQFRLMPDASLANAPRHHGSDTAPQPTAPQEPDAGPATLSATSFPLYTSQPDTTLQKNAPSVVAPVTDHATTRLAADTPLDDLSDAISAILGTRKRPDDNADSKDHADRTVHTETREQIVPPQPAPQSAQNDTGAAPVTIHIGEVIVTSDAAAPPPTPPPVWTAPLSLDAYRAARSRSRT